MGLDFDQLFPNRFLKAGEFQGRDVTLKIKGVKIETLQGDKGEEVKGILSFEATTKQLVLNKTNGLCLKALFGRDTSAWIGKRVTFWPAPIDFGDAEIAIRVRGSPDIPADVEFELKLARKKARKVKLVRTGQKPPVGQQQTAKAPATPPPADSVQDPALAAEPNPFADQMNPETGEVPFA